MQAFFNAVNDYADRVGKEVVFVRDFTDKGDNLVMWALFNERDGMGAFQVEVKELDPIKAVKAAKATKKSPARKAREAETPEEFAERVEKKIAKAFFDATKARRHSKQLIPYVHKLAA